MRKRECPNCAVEVPEDRESCYICGYEFPQTRKRFSKWVAIILIIIFLIPLVTLLIRLLR